MDDPGSSPPKDSPRLLLVERNEAMRTMLTTMLAAHYRVEAVCDGLTAFQAAKTHPPALVVIDLYVPGTDNLTLIRSLRAGEATARTPVILLTPSVDGELLLRCLTAGANNFLLKPFGMAELLSCLRRDLKPHDTTAGSPA